MTFAASLSQFATETQQRSAALFVGVVVDLRDSIVLGSGATGAPAMPVAPGQFARAGALRDSVTVTYPDEHTALIHTTSPYALDVEDNPKGHTFASGGPHGWKMTAAAFPRVVETVATRHGAR